MQGPKNHQTWQETLARRFFSSNRAGLRVRLNIDEDDFPIEGGDLESLLAAVHTEVESEGCETILELLAKQARQFRRTVYQLRQSGDSPPKHPPCVLPSLALLVLAVHHGGERFEPNDYYRRLRDLMGYSAAVDINSGPMRKANRAWSSLEEWSCLLQMGRRGMFRVRVLGGMRYIGIPLRQALLSPRDERMLVNTFLQENIDPSSSLSRTAAIELASRAGLRARARKLTYEYPQSLESQDLADDICDVFEEWQGKEQAIQQTTVRKSRIRICAAVNQDGLDSLRSVVTLPKGLQSIEWTIPSSTEKGGPNIRIQAAESIGLGQEVLLDGGESLAESVDWFTEQSWTIEAGVGGILFVHRPEQPTVYFESDGGHQLEERFTHELEVGNRYLEVRRTSSESKGPPSDEWESLDSPQGLQFRGYEHLRSNADHSRSRIVCRLRHGIRSLRGGSTFFDFAPPMVEWSGVADASASVHLRAFDQTGIVVDQSSITPVLVKQEIALLADTGDSGSSTLRVDLQPFLNRTAMKNVAAVELELENAGDMGRAMIYIEQSSLVTKIESPPRRNRFGQLDENGQLLGRTSIDASDASLTIPDIPTGREVALSPLQPIHDLAHDRVARLLRALGSLPWIRARDMIAQCGDHNTFNDARDVTNQILALHQSGVLELVESKSGGFAQVMALAPRLAVSARRLNLGPRLGGGYEAGRKFNLTGAWLPKELTNLFRKTEPAGGLIPQLADPTVTGTLLSGDRSVIAITDTAVQQLATIADELGIQFEPDIPDALSSLSAMAPISELLCDLDWRVGPPPEFSDQWEFDPDRICRTQAADAKIRLRFLECRYSDRPIWVYFLHDVEKKRHAAVTDRQLGRWAIRQLRHPEAPIPVGSMVEIIVPRELRLPRHLERAFALESGATPEALWFPQGRGTSGSPFNTPRIAQKFEIPGPPDSKIRPYEVPNRACGAFLLYPGIHGTPLWPRNSPMPVLNAPGESISTIALTNDRRSSR